MNDSALECAARGVMAEGRDDEDATGCRRALVIVETYDRNKQPEERLRGAAGIWYRSILTECSAFVDRQVGSVQANLCGGGLAEPCTFLFRPPGQRLKSTKKSRLDGGDRGMTVSLIQL